MMNFENITKGRRNKRNGMGYAASLLSRVFLLSLSLVLAGTLFAPGLLAQIDTGTISGTVFDPSGAVVAGATVTLQNQATAFAQSQTAKQDGTYQFSAVKIGNYTVSVSAPGFSQFQQRGIKVAILARLVVDIHMKVGSATSSVQVTGGQSTLQTESASVGQVVSGREINALPLNGRNYTLLAQLAPGTTTTYYDNGHGEVQSGSFTANGMITVFNNYMLDGISNNSDTADFGNGTAYAILPPPDALAEFRVETANYTAEYGRSGGAVINAVTMSGQNKFFGDAWEYNRNAFFDANDYFLNQARQPRPPYNRNQYGASLGGPVTIPHLYSGRDRTFFFMDYSALRINQGQARSSSVPTALERSSGFTNYSDLITQQKGTQTDLLGRTTPVGTVFDPATTRYLTKGYVDPVTGLPANSSGYVREPFAHNIVPAGRLSPVAAKLLALFPAPNTGGGSLVNNYASAPILLQNADAFDVRVDQNFSAQDQLFVRGSYALTPRIIAPPCPGLAECGTSATVGTENTNILGLALGETHVFSPRFLNELRIGYNRIHMNRLAPFGGTGGLNEENGIPGIPDGPGNGGLTQIKITGLSEMGGHNNVPLDEIGAETQFNDNLSLIRGKHSMRFGAQYQGIENAIKSAPYPHGEFVFGGGFTIQPQGVTTASTGITDFALQPVPSLASGCTVISSTSAPPNVPGCYTYNFVGGASQIQGSPLAQQDYRKPYFGVYFTDTWKLLPNLTLDAGLRYEYFSYGSDHQGHAANLLPSFASKDGSSQFLIDDRSRNVPLSPSFISLMTSQGIAITYTKNHHLGDLSPMNFAPRIGLAWQTSPRTVFRAGFGLFYAGIYNRGDGVNIGDNYPFTFTVNLRQTTSAGLSNDGSIGAIDKGLTGVPLNPAQVVGSQISPIGNQYYAHVPYVQAANFTFQYQITDTQDLQIAYVGTQSRHVESDIESNRPSLVLPTPLPAGKTITNYLPYPGLPQNNYYTWNEGSNNYNSLQTKYEKIFGNGVFLIADYTWEKLLGYGSDSSLYNFLSYRAPFVPGFGMKGEYGNGDFESENIFHSGGSWELPFGRNRRWLHNGGVSGALLGGWNLNGIVTYQSGQPVTVSCSIGTVSGSGCYALPDKSTLYTGAKTVKHWFNAAAFSNPAPATTVGQTDFSPFGSRPGQGFGPAFHRGDFGIQKLFHLPHQNIIELRGEAFNVTNTPNFGQPGTLSPVSKNFAQITGTRDNPSDGREFQFAVKYLFGGGHQE